MGCQSGVSTVAQRWKNLVHIKSIDVISEHVLRWHQQYEIHIAHNLNHDADPLCPEVIFAHSPNRSTILGNEDFFFCMNKKIYNNIFFDFDSTLVACESLDLLADRRGVGDGVRRLTTASMNGDIPLEGVLQEKMKRISPDLNDIEAVVEFCSANIVDGVIEVIEILQLLKKNVHVLSSNFHCIIDPVAQKLGIPPHNVFANRLIFSKGQYKQIAKQSLLLSSHGKADLLEKKQMYNAGSVMIGDSMSDNACRGVVDLFVGFGGVELRQRVRDNSEVYIDVPNMFPLLQWILTDEEREIVRQHSPDKARAIGMLATTTTTTDADLSVW